MEKNNSKKLYYAEISDVIFRNLKKNNFVLKSNDFAICEYTNSNIKISLGLWRQSLSKIQKKLKAGEFVVKQNNESKDELYFVFFKKDLAGQPNNDVEDVLLLPSDEILGTLIMTMPSERKDIHQLAKLIGQNIRDNENMNWQQRLSGLYHGKNNENNIITNENIDPNNNINQENNNINVNNNLNNDIFEENKEIKNENNNIEEKENIDNINENGNENSNENKNNNENTDNIENNKSKDEYNINDNINPENNKEELQNKPNNENTVSLFGLGCCSMQSDKRNDHCCGSCFW